MNGRAPFPVRDAEASAMPEPEQRLTFSLLETLRAFEQGRTADGIRGLGHAVQIAGNRSRELTADESRLLSRATTTGARMVTDW